jgi:hypothetical protein
MVQSSESVTPLALSGHGIESHLPTSKLLQLGGELRFCNTRAHLFKQTRELEREDAKQVK